MQNLSSGRVTYQIYRKTTLGTTLQESLDELIQNGKITSDQADRVLHQFDSRINSALATRIRNRLAFKAKKLNSYRFCDDVWTLLLEDVEFRRLGVAATADKLKIVACNGNK